MQRSAAGLRNNLILHFSESQVLRKIVYFWAVSTAFFVEMSL